ncbi:MAG: CidA/LrgA family protein [Endomicrobiaceae bacterium]|jgi:holin-like protein|nr:CidA/LrgA family protein [Endomicrobiaceae bacterium]
MKLIKTAASLCILIGLNFLCQRLVSALNINFPASLIGMIILSLLMYFKIIKVEFIEYGGELLLNNISLFFVPLLVGGIGYLFVVKNDLMVIFEIFIITSVVLIIVTGLLVQYLLMKKIYRKRKEQLSKR